MGDENAAPGADKPKLAKLYIGQHGPSVWRAGMEMGNPISDGLSAFASHFPRRPCSCVLLSVLKYWISTL